MSPQRATGISFTTPSVGFVTIVNTWGSAANQLTVQIGRHTRTTSVSLSPAGNYIFWARNGGTTEETVSYQVFITP